MKFFCRKIILQSAGNNYDWKVGGNWNHIHCIADAAPVPITPGSAEEFITEHYWGYTFINTQCTGVYEVVHPK